CRPLAARPRKGRRMPRSAWLGPSTQRTAVQQFSAGVRALAPLLLVWGCAPWHHSLPVPPEVNGAGVGARILIPSDLNVNPSESVAKPRPPGRASLDPPAPPGVDGEPTTFALPDAIAYALQNNPRLRSARAAIERARGQEQVAFAPFLPQLDFFAQGGIT